MKSVLRLVAAIAFSCSTITATAQNAVIVCGVPLDDPGLLSWDNYLESATEPRRSIDHVALSQIVQPLSSRWPQTVRISVLSALDSLRQGELRPAAIKISRTADLPPTQIGFANTPHAVELPFTAESALCRDPGEAAARIDAGYVILLVERAHAAVLGDRVLLAVDQIAALEEEYDRYLFEGFPMFPWEAWANGVLLTKDTVAQGPPRNAIVLLHPAAGFIGNVESGARSDVGGVLSIEPVGWIRYSRDYDKWYGLSLLAVFPADRNAGYGVAFNYRNYKLGVTWHDDESGEHDGAAIFLGVDLLQFLDSKHREYEGYKEKLERTLRSVGVEE